MEIDFSDLSPSQVYSTVIQTLVPRPIAWVLSENKNQSYNLAPFSYFNAVSSDPPVVMMSLGRQADGSKKDTHINIESRKHFVIHIPAADQVDDVNASSATLGNEISEVDEYNIQTTPFKGSVLPRITGCPVAFYCELFDIIEVGNTPMTMILGEIKAAYISDNILDESEQNKLRVNTKKMDPLGRLGGPSYISIGDIITRKRPA